MFAGLLLLLLTHTGARSGAVRTAPLVYTRDGDRLVIIASKAGAPTNPDRYHNLVANPATTVELPEETFPARARVVEGEERDRLFAAMAAEQPQFAEYQRSTTRRIPVVVPPDRTRKRPPAQRPPSVLDAPFADGRRRRRELPYTNRPIRDMLPLGPGVVALTRGRSLRVGAVLACAALAMLVPVGGAQSPSSGTPSSGEETGDGPHPAHIHSGTCDELGDVVLPLTDVADPAAEGERVGPDSAFPVKTSRTVVEQPLQEIIDGGHAINVHLSSEEIGEYIACGDIGGVVTPNEDGGTDLLIALGELNDSGHTGIAWLGSDGENTEVPVTLIEPDEMS